MLFIEKLYVLDTSTLSQLFLSYYRDNFPTLWHKFDKLLKDSRIVSTREVLLELGDGHRAEKAHRWAKIHEHLFSDPTPEEARFVARILQQPRFQNILMGRKQKVRKRSADPFLIAHAKQLGGTVVTEEAQRLETASIFAICAHFDIPCIILKQLMDQEGWVF